VATLDRDANLELEVCVEQGRGYQPAEKREPEPLPVNAILMDADFSPVTRVNFHVGPLAPPSDSQERLILEVWTTGSVTPETAVADAARILDDQFAWLIDVPPAPPAEIEGAETGAEAAVGREGNEHLFRNVEELERAVRPSNCLKTANIRIVADLVQKTESDLLKTKNFGKKSLNEIKTSLGEMGLSLGICFDPEELERFRADYERTIET